MKIEVALLNNVRFETDPEHTKLHVHTGHVDPNKPLMVEPKYGPLVHLRSVITNYPLTNGPTPYGAGRSEYTAFVFNTGGVNENWATTAGSDTPTLPTALDLRDALRLSLFFRPDTGDTSDEDVLIAGVPGQYGLYQHNTELRLVLTSGGSDYVAYCDALLEPGAWHLFEVQWDRLVNSGAVMWFMNGVRMEPMGAALEAPLDGPGDRFNLAHAGGTAPFWQGALRELELSDEIVWVEDAETTEARMGARAMRLFGLATGTTPTPLFTRNSVAWIRVGGLLHKVTWHHPRATDLGTAVEEQRENVIGYSAPPVIWIEGGDHDNTAEVNAAKAEGWVYDAPSDPDDHRLDYWTGVLDKGRYTLWLEQSHTASQEPITLAVKLGGETEPSYTVREGEPVVVEVMSNSTVVEVWVEGEGQLEHVQLERGETFSSSTGMISLAVGPTSHIPTTAGPVTRALETLAYKLARADLDNDQGRLDLEMTPQMDGPRAEVGSEAAAGEILGISLTHDEIVSVDGADDVATLPGKGLWKSWATREFHVEWQPGARLMWEDTLQLVAAADYSGEWPWPEGEDHAWFYIGGGGDETGDRHIRANSFFRGLVLDDWVPRYHADLHRFMYRQFGTGGFSADQDSVFRKWRRVEADGLGLMARLGDRLKDQAFPDTVDLMLKEWESAVGIPSLWGLPADERREVLANLFKALGATDAEIEEQVSRVTGFAAVIERHKGDVGPDLKEMYEYYIQIPESFYKQTYLELIRWLLERQEPAHTVGHPVVRTEMVTSSDTYGKLVTGPEIPDQVEFDDVGSMTERDCVGLPGYPGDYPQGMWMPTNEGPTERDDPWAGPLRDILLPTVLFPCHENGSTGQEDLKNMITGTGIIVLEPKPDTAELQYETHCTGLFVADKEKQKDDSAVTLNIRRGVEILDPTYRFESDPSAPGDAEKIFNLGADKSAAFMHVFRVTALPSTGDAVLFRAGLDSGGDTYAYTVSVDSNGDLVAKVESDTVSTSKTFGPGLRVGEWLCALTVIDRKNHGLMIYGPEGKLAEDPLDISGWEMAAGDITFSLGDPAGAASALVHHTYFAAWMGPHAPNLNALLIERFWRALLPDYVIALAVDPDDSQDQTCWPIGGSPDEVLLGTLAAKYSRGQFPFAAVGEGYDGRGELFDVRGYGCNRQIENEARKSEDLEDPVWTWEPGTATLSKAISPEGLHNATRADWGGTAAEVYGDVSVDPTATDYVSVACWIRTVPTGDPPVNVPDECSVFLRHSGGGTTGIERLEAFPETVEFGSKWSRLVSVFDVSGLGGPSALEFGVERTGSGTAPSWVLWGFQCVKAPVLSPYAPNPSDSTSTTSPATVMAIDEDRFPGYEDRGFVSFRVKPEELLDLMPDGRRLALLDAYTVEDGGGGPEVVARAFVEIMRPEPDNGEQENVQLRFTFGFKHPECDDDWWWDRVTVDPLGWTDHTIEHRVAVAWDVTRPVALTTRNLAMWVDNELALVLDEHGQPTNYRQPRPIDVIDRSVTLRRVAIGCSYCDVEGLDPPPGETRPVQPCAVIREVEQFSRHHPGLFTPTRQEMREEAEAVSTV